MAVRACRAAPAPCRLGCVSGPVRFALYAYARRLSTLAIWSGVSATAACWERAFSLDDGETWLTNWTMDFTRPPGS